jgi:hypothetical protein
MATPSPIEMIVQACRAGHQTLLVSGRSLFDLHINEAGAIRPLRHSLMRRVQADFGMATLRFDMAFGSQWDYAGFSPTERRAYEQRLQQSQLPLLSGIRDAEDGTTYTPHERAFFLLASLQRSLGHGGELPPLLSLWEFAEDIAPDTGHGSLNDWSMQFAEALQSLAHDYQRRRHPLLLILCGTPEWLDDRVVNCLYPVALPQPDRAEKLHFLQQLRATPQHRAAVYEDGLDDHSVANLTARTPNRSLEETFLDSARTGRPITYEELTARKRTDVVSLSEGTLSLLDTERVQNTRLAGRTVTKPLALLSRWAESLKAGNPHTPMSVILAGAPATAKTDLALLTAQAAQVPAYQLISPKGSLVGQTERLVRLQFRVYKELSPAFGFIDEITEAFQMERNGANLDSGASAAVTAEMLSALSDTSRAGKTLLIATTNCPWRVGTAMASRFLFLPVLSALEEDYPAILTTIAAGFFPEETWETDDKVIQAAACLFYRKGATPRTMRTLIAAKLACQVDALPDPALLLRAAEACALQDPRDRAGAEYADLFAIRACSDLEMLPWHGCIADYPLPESLRGIVSEQDGSIDLDRLHHRLEELKPHVNV